MNQTTADNPPEALDVERTDLLDRIERELDGLSELDPAEAVAVLADITAELNRELDSDSDRS
jgi:hypothetical protein